MALCSSRALALLAGVVTYLAALVLLRVPTPEEWDMLAPLVPARLRQAVST